MKGWYEEAEKWPEATPATTGATNKKKKLVDVALGNFALVLIEPTFADWIQLGTCMSDRRTCFYGGGDRDHRRTLKHALYPWWHEHLNY
jgi:pyridoxamine 5'-phosphate oxidase